MMDKLIIPLFAGTVLLLLLLSFIVYFIFLYRKKQRDFELERQAFEQTVLQTKVEIQKETQQQIAMELHDNLGQMASFLKLNLNLMTKTDDVSELIQESKTVSQDLINGIKSVSRSLNQTDLLSEGLSVAIRNELSRYSQKLNFMTECKIDPAIESINKEKQLLIYRMVQEMLHNIQQHAQASKVMVSIDYLTNFVLRVTDNGKGFEPKTVLYGAGLNNLKTRSKMLNGQLDIIPLPQGVTFEITFSA